MRGIFCDGKSYNLFCKKFFAFFNLLNVLLVYRFSVFNLYCLHFHSTSCTFLFIAAIRSFVITHCNNTTTYAILWVKGDLSEMQDIFT